MTSCTPIIAVNDVQKSSEWYQTVFNCKRTHGGDVFEMLADERGQHFLFLHKWGSHGHPTLESPNATENNGLILYFTVADIDAVWQNAMALHAKIEERPKISENTGKKEFSIRDIDGYYLMISKT